MIPDPSIREAKRIWAAHLKAQRKAKPKVIPVQDGRQRQPRERDAGYLAFLRRQPCAIGGAECTGPIEAAHIRYATLQYPNPGLQSKSHDRRAIAMCSWHHRVAPNSQHSMNERRFWSIHGIDPDVLAAKLYRQYQGGENG